MKNKLVLSLVLILLLTVLLVPAASADGDVSWTVEDGVLTVAGTGAMADYASAADVPWAAEDIYSVTVEEGVTHVGSYAFSGLFLDNVLLLETLESIGENAFYGAAVTEAHFAGNLKQWEKDTVIGDGNDALTAVIVCDKDVTYEGEGFSLANGVVTSYVPSLPSEFKQEYDDYVFEVVFVDVTEIGESACGSFYDDKRLTNMTSVTIPDSVISIEDIAFRGCSSLTSVTIPDGVTNIGVGAFMECSNLEIVVIPNSVTSIGSSLFYNCSSLTSVTIPDSVTSIGEGAFYNCSSLTSVTIPDGVTSIDSSVFYGCSGLTSITIPDSVTSIGYTAFYRCSGLTSVTIPDSVTSIGEGAFMACIGMTNVTIPDSVISIGEGAFGDCTSLTRITIPDSVTSIKSYMFGNCSSLESVTIPQSVISIESFAFWRCGLRDIYYFGTEVMWDEISIDDYQNSSLLNAVRHYALAAGETGDCRWSLSESWTLRISGDGRMADCTEGTAPWYPYYAQITTIEVGSKVKYLGSYAFSGLENAATVSGMTGVTSIGEGAFEGCTALPALTLPAAVTNVGQNAFSGCTLLTSAGPVDSGAAIEFGWNRVIPANAFNGADCLESLTIPEGVTRLMASAAANCTALTTVSLPGTLTNIQQSAFSGCASLTEIALPDGLKTLGASAFRDTGLTSVTIPESVTSIGSNAFDGSLLTDVYYPGSRNQWNAITIGADNTALSGAALHFGRFDINIDSEITNGSVSARVNGEAAATALENDSVSLTVTPATGYTLESLSVMQGETPVTVENNQFTMPAGDVTATAVFTPIRYSVSFDNEFGTAPEDQIVNEGGKAAAPADPTEDGYRFSGWYAVKDGFDYDWVSEEGWSLIFEDGEYTYTCPIMPVLNTWELTDENGTTHSGDEYLRLWDFDTDTVTADMCLFARWKLLYDLTVSDDLENGTVQADKDLAAESDTVILTVTPATGYELESLSVMQGETPVTVENNQFTMPAGGVTVTATFKKLTYTITWLNDDDSVIDTTTVEYGETPTHADAVKAATAEFTYSFAGWTPEPVPVTEDAVYTASYTEIRNRYTVTWLDADGSVLDTVTLAYAAMPTHADATKAASAEFTYSFAGWTPEVVAVTGDATYTATFTETVNIYTVHFDTGGGTPVPEDQRVAYGGHAVQPDLSPARTGFRFDGWYCGETLFRFDATEITGDITLTARWEALQYTIIWVNDDNTVIGYTTVAHGEIPTHEAPEKADDAQYFYTFAGWDPEPAPATGVTLYTARYTKTEKIPCTLSFDPNGGHGGPETLSGYAGQNLTLPDAVPTREGWIFVGWAESAEAERPACLPGGSYPAEGDATLYALWEQPDFILPNALREIGEEAFSGGGFRFAALPNGAESIGPRAFAECPALRFIRIPASVTDIDPTAFEGVAALIILGVPDSEAESFAQAGGFGFVAVAP